MRHGRFSWSYGPRPAVSDSTGFCDPRHTTRARPTGEVGLTLNGEIAVGKCLSGKRLWVLAAGQMHLLQKRHLNVAEEGSLRMLYRVNQNYQVGGTVGRLRLTLQRYATRA
jgi:hypothetical protein